jgi:Spy/CpxP family protein refolding chaperone
MKLPRLVSPLALLVLCALALAPAPAHAQAFKWWSDDNFKKELGLTAEQTARLETVFQDALPTLRKHKESLDRAQADFDRLVEKANDATVMEQVNQIESARADLNRARVMMLLKMRRSLTADQWAKFTALQQQRQSGRATRPNPR